MNSRSSGLLLLVAIVFATLLLPFRSGYAAEESSGATASSWPPKNYTKVVAYHFSIPGESSTAMRNGLLDFDALKQHTIKSAELSQEQVGTLLKAAASDAPKTPMYACYDAHHTFVFFDKNDHPVGAFEVCFACLGTIYSPGEPEGKQPDFRELAKLCEPLVGMEKDQTAKKFSQRLDQVEKEMRGRKKDEEAKASKSWSPKDYDHVVAYHFQGGDGFSVIRDGKVDAKLLERVALKKATLSKDQEKELIKAASTESLKRSPHYACYDPHHVFVFYDKEDQIVGALEVCFECLGEVLIPEPRKGPKLDYPALAKMCENLVGMEKGNSAAKVAETIDKLNKGEWPEGPGSEEEQPVTPASEGH